MSEIIRPDGSPAHEPNSGDPRPGNREVLSFIEKQRQEQEAASMANKILDMHGQEQNGRRNKQLNIAVQIVMVQLDGDAKLLEAVAQEPGTVLADKHDKMMLARCFRVTMGWLQGLISTQQVVDNAKGQKPENQ